MQCQRNAEMMRIGRRRDGGKWKKISMVSENVTSEKSVNLRAKTGGGDSLARAGEPDRLKSSLDVVPDIEGCPARADQH